MTRSELCEKLAQCRKESGVKMKDICFSMNTMPITVYRMENGDYGFTLQNLLLLLDALKYSLCFKKKNGKTLVANTQSDIATFFKSEREKQKTSLRDFAQKTGLSINTIRVIESIGKNTYIDGLLLYVQNLDYDINIIPKQQ